MLPLLALAPFALAFCYGMGFASGMEALEDGDPKHRIQVGDGGGDNALDLEILRSFSDWMVVVPKPEPNEFLWIRMDDMGQIEVLDARRFSGIVCWFFRT